MAFSDHLSIFDKVFVFFNHSCLILSLKFRFSFFLSYFYDTVYFQ